MPELPEVETIKRALKKTLQGATITNVALSNKRLRFPISKNALSTIIGQRITGIRRRAKYLLFDLENNLILLAHLGMTGKFYLAHASEQIRQHDHIRLTLANGHELRFNDVRRFGFVDILQRDHANKHDRLKNLGVEPLEKTFNGQCLFSKTRKTKKPIKNLLMDAKVVVGVGNIYASEALFMAGVHPKKIASNLTKEQCNRIAIAVKQVLNDSIKQGGTTLKDFASLNGEQGYFAMRLQVYGRRGENCTVCSKPIDRLVLAGRSTFFCKNCQKL
jgi:formamidopyrimidine-DNA glycosylase